MLIISSSNVHFKSKIYVYIRSCKKTSYIETSVVSELDVKQKK